MRTRINLLESVVDAVGSRFERDAARIAAEGAGGPPGVTSFSKRAATMDIMAGGSGKGEGRLFELIEDYGDAESKALMNQRRAHIDAQAIAARKAVTRDSFSPGLKIGTMSPEELSESAVVGSTPYQRFMLNAEKRNAVADERALQASLFQMEIKTNPEMQAVQKNLAQKEMAVQLGGRNQSNVPLQQLQEKLRRSNVASGSSVTLGSSQGGATQVAGSPASKSTTSSPANKAAAGSEVGSKQAADITGYENMMGGGATLLTAGAGGLIGGVTSYATGGDFFQGAAAGSIIGAGGVAAGMGIMNANRSFLAKNAAGINDAVSSMSTSQRRNAMFAGAGLSGMVFGGDRRSHRRGFNQSRGNTF